VRAGKPGSADFFSAVVRSRDAKLAANWVMVELYGVEPAR
jgi:Asp-tRNA(Asn)/Glu-tRNA(Gln) amidotransferase B subunit